MKSRGTSIDFGASDHVRLDVMVAFCKKFEVLIYRQQQGPAPRMRSPGRALAQAPTEGAWAAGVKGGAGADKGCWPRLRLARREMLKATTGRLQISDRKG